MLWRIMLPVLLLMLFSAGLAYTADGRPASYPVWKAGPITVTTLVDAESTMSRSILIGAAENLVNEFLPGGATPGSVNAFLIQTPEHNILVDTGFGRNLLDHLKKLNLQAGDIHIVLLTHMHGDHIGGLMKDKKPVFSNARIYVAEKEKDYWTDPVNMSAVADDKRAGFILATETLSAYGQRVVAFTPQALGDQLEELLPGIKSLAAYGHTPGHTMFLLENMEKRLLIWGDLTHLQNLQMAAPDIAVTYDVDPEAAVKTRLEVLEYVSQNHIAIAGMHIVSPGMGLVEKGDGKSYIYTPMTK